jgi:hypothetical protein
MFTLTGGSNWMCTTSEDEWPFADLPEAREEIRKDFEGTWGDREPVCSALSLTADIALCFAGRQERKLLYGISIDAT